MMVYKGKQNLLRASIMSASNSHRLGANEAPPAILSCFLGSQLSATLDEIVRQVGNEKMTPEEKTTLKLGIGRIPEILLDTTDRNRTSPFAFTGNRFEFRCRRFFFQLCRRHDCYQRCHGKPVERIPLASVEKAYGGRSRQRRSYLPSAERDNHRFRTDPFQKATAIPKNGNRKLHAATDQHLPRPGSSDALR